MTVRHLVLGAGLLLVVAFMLSFRAPLPTLAPDVIIPVPPDDLWKLNQG